MVAERRTTAVWARGASGPRLARIRRSGRIPAPPVAAAPQSRDAAWRGLILPVVAWALGAAVFFRNQLTSGFDRLMGDPGDARLIVLLHEHWYAVIGGHAVWNDPAFYHPTEGVLGYCDTAVLNTLIYAPLRAAGLDPFLAFQWTLVALSAIGFGALYAVLRRYLHVRPTIAAAGCLLFCFANNAFTKGGHPQLLFGWWTPLCVLMGLVAVRHREARVRLVAAACCGTLALLIVYTAFYAGWTALASAALMALAILVTRPRAFTAFCRRRWQELAAALGGAAVGGIPVVLTYLPVLEDKGGRTYEEVMLYAPRPADVVNVGSGNYLWGSALRGTFGPDDPRLVNGERALAITPLLLLGTAALLVALSVITARRSRAARRDHLRQAPLDSGYVFACAASFAAVLLVVLPIDVNGWSLWRPVWEHVPGASALRATARMQVVGSQLVAVAFAVSLSRVVGERGRRTRGTWIAARVAGAGLVAVVLVEQLNLSPTSLLDHSDERASLRVVPPVPPGCSSFFVTWSGPRVSPIVLQVDAMLIASDRRIPTINGYSGQAPDGWTLLDPQEPGYLDHVRRWAVSTGTSEALCAYDVAARTWDDTPLG